MEEAKVKLEVRLYALEYLVTNAFLILYRSIGVPKSVIEESHNELLEVLKNETFPTDPATSDMIAAEVYNAVERLLEMQQEVLGIEKKPK